MIEVNLLDVAKMQTAVQTVNRRLSTLADTFGTDSYFYQQEVAKIDAQVPSENIVYKEGVFQLRQPKKLAQAGVDSDYLKTLIRTKADIKKEYQRGYEEVIQNKEDENIEIADGFNVYKYAEDTQQMLSHDNLKIISEKAKAGDPDAVIAMEILTSPTKTYKDLWIASQYSRKTINLEKQKRDAKSKGAFYGY